MPTPRLPNDYARCADGESCPFADVCRRRLTIAYDLLQPGHYPNENFKAAMVTTADGDPWCAHRIIYDPQPLEEK